MPDPKSPASDGWITPTREDHIEIPPAPDAEEDAEIEDEDQDDRPLTGDNPAETPPPVSAHNPESIEER